MCHLLLTWFSVCVVIDDDDEIERVCDTLLMCIITVLNQGLRNGGGVGDILRRPSKEVGKLRNEYFLHLLQHFYTLYTCLY